MGKCAAATAQAAASDEAPLEDYFWAAVDSARLRGIVDT